MTSASHVWRVLVASSLAILWATSNVHALDFQTIENAWRERAARAGSITIKWSETREYVTPTVRPTMPDVPGGQPIKQKVPSIVMYLSDKQIRLDDVCRKSIPGDFALTSIGAWNGAQARSLLLGGARPFGSILTDRKPTFASAINVAPPLLFYRGSDGSLRPNTLSKFAPPDGELTDNHDGTVSFHANTMTPEHPVSTWILTMRIDADFAPIRLTGKSSDQTIYDFVIELDQPRFGVQIPKSWTVNFSPGNRDLRTQILGKVLSCEIGKPIDQTLFDLPFSEGTVVTDLRPTLSGGDERIYMIAKGVDRDITVEETLRGASWEEIRQTPTGQAGLPK